MRRVWADLTGASDRWGRTIVYGVIFARLSLAPGALLVFVLHGLTTGDWTGSGALDGFSGRIKRIDGVTIFATLVLAPLLETGLLAFLAWLLGFRLKLPLWTTAGLTGLAFIPLHGLSLGSLLVAPFFVLMAAIWCHWKRRGDGLGGFWVVATLHATAKALALLTSWAFAV